MQKVEIHYRNKQIDGLRAVMILMIVIFHLTCRFQQLYTNSDIPFVKYWGGIGALVFLMISSYFAAETKISQLPIKIFRLWPAYFISITITMFVLSVLPVEGRMCTWKDYLINIFFLNGYINIPYVDGAHWYITTLISSLVVIALINKSQSNECIGSFLIWIIVSICFKITKLTMFTLLIAGSYSGIVSIGIAIKRYIKFYKEKKIALCRKWLLLLLIGLGATGYLMGMIKTVEAGIAIIIVGGSTLEKFPILNCRLLQFIGAISYPLYLLHQNISYAIELYMIRRIGSFSIIYSVVAFTFVFILAIIVYKYVEKPFNKWLKKAF
ncbi:MULTISPECIES: acyltransferase [Clostridia]|uniref:acyltransferase family protein n=1 Tax=Clostridia TaxID=186801 RepID=UPI00067ED846|nr:MULTISPECIES: acyltransferase [Clostridia]